MSMRPHNIVSEQEWRAARKALLVKEKELTRARDQLSAERRALPWVKVEKNYMFDTPHGNRPLAELFNGKSQLLVYHFMLGPGWKAGCPSCSYLADHFDGMLPHLAARDVTFTAISRASLAEIDVYKRRMGWHFPWASSFANDFNFDYGVSFELNENGRGRGTYNYQEQDIDSDEMPGLSAFYKDANGEIFHTYSAYARGLDNLVGTYNFLDVTPKGRDEDQLPWTMAWVRRHDEYNDAPKSESCCGSTQQSGAA
jgi:predicted dithiol-disulfide oxidoreductase (DUF899 family)